MMQGKSNTPAEIKDSWETPEWLFKFFDKRFGFEWDLAASDFNHLCRLYYTEERSALENIWGNRCWLNPPYSNITPWVDHLFDEKFFYTSVVAVCVPLDATAWFKRLSYLACEMHLFSTRVNFIRPDTGREQTGNNRGTAVFIVQPASQFYKTDQLITTMHDIKELRGES